MNIPDPDAGASGYDEAPPSKQTFPRPDTMTLPASPEEATVIARTQAWLTRAVIGLNLCPFAKGVQARGQIRTVVCDAADEATLLVTLLDEFEHLLRADPERTDTTLLIHPRVLTDFHAFNRFLGDAEGALARAGYEGVFQLASFHPQYRFAGTASDDVTNATNRSPYPMLHVLREASVERAVAGFPDAARIYEQNMRTLQALGARKWQQLMHECHADAQRLDGPPKG